MNRPFSEIGTPLLKGRNELLLPILVLWALALIVVAVFFWSGDGVTETLGDYYLIPWAILTAGVLLSPAMYLYFRGKLDPFHPLVFGVWSYLFPAFVGGALILTFDITEPYFMSFIEDPEYNLPLSLVYVCLGFIGLVAGFYTPVGRIIGEKIEGIMPKKKWETNDVWLPGIFLILAGVGLNIFGFLQGLLGYQRVDEIGLFDGLLVFLITVFTLGYILLWLGVFHLKRGTMISYAVIALLLLLIPLKMALQGSRGSLITSVIPIGLAYWYSGRRIKFAHGALFGGLIFAALAIGIIYGTTFRNIKGSEARMSAGDYAGQVVATVDYLSQRDLGVIFGDAGQAFAERIENLSSLAVVVSNYEKLEPYEESYGIKNNIVNEFLTAFIPRFLWPEKPMVSDARSYSELYFDYGDNSFAITVFGDLLRNFGPIGIPIGMLLMGICFRVIYDVLILSPEPRIWKKAAYFPLLVLVNYEGFYSSIVPGGIRVATILILGLLVANFFTRRNSP